MPSIYTKKSDEDDVVDDVEQDEEEEELQASAPAVSDSRRRRQMKRGELPTATTADVSTTRKDRPTPSQRREVVESNNPIVRFYRGIIEYLQETRDELKKVAWLSREDTLRLTYIVLIVTAISAAFLGFVSFLFALLTQALATRASTVGAGALAMVLIVGVSGAWLFRDRLFGGHIE